MREHVTLKRGFGAEVPADTWTQLRADCSLKPAKGKPAGPSRFQETARKSWQGDRLALVTGFHQFPVFFFALPCGAGSQKVRRETKPGDTGALTSEGLSSCRPNQLQVGNI